LRILFTGGSSFTGYWFVHELTSQGHSVIPIVRRQSDTYDGIRGVRVQRLRELCEQVVDQCSFGDEKFLGLAEEGPWDLLCHHAAETANYTDPSFDAVAALVGNVQNVRRVLKALAVGGCTRLALTGTIFEADEGDGDDPRAFSPYGLSKTLTYQTFRYYAAAAGLQLGKFVIPNPFGPLEEPRFTTYLLRSWLKGEVPIVRTPDYVRDNIHVSLLARAYVAFVGGLSEQPGVTAAHPSQYRGSQRDFAVRVAHEMEARLDLPCPVEFARQTQFVEPRVRVNTEDLDPRALGWDETQAWDDLADFYLSCVDTERAFEPAP
jgi:UDP-glucose 4-epimerase